MIPTPPFMFGVKLQQRLNFACNLVRYYAMIRQTLTIMNLQWTPNMPNFKELWKTIEQSKKLDTLITPKISKAMAVMKWTESLSDHLDRIISI